MSLFRNQTPTVTARVAYCVIVDSMFDANQQNKIGLVNLFYCDVITIAKLKIWAPSADTVAFSNLSTLESVFKSFRFHRLPVDET